MTLNDYEKARDLVTKIGVLKGEMSDLKTIIQNDTSSWMMEVMPSASFSSKKINHHGLLPEFLQAILSKYLAELHELEKELDKL